jgi:hypothetical protein
LAEAQARGDTPALAGTPVERTLPPPGELDTRRSKSSLSIGVLLGQDGANPGSDSPPSGDAAPPPDASSEGEPVPQDPSAVPSDEGLGLVFQRSFV